jgi:diguanylate cyclase (GGDEF)-like protein
MKRWLPVGALILVWTATVWAAAPGALTSVRAIRQLSRAEAAKALPVAFEGTVTYYNPNDVDLFVQDDGQAIYVGATIGANLALGDRVLVEGKTRDSFRTDIVSERVTVLHHGALPVPLKATFDQMIGSKLDSMRVTVRAVVRSADVVVDGNRRDLYMHLLMDGGYLDATVVGSNATMLNELLDAEVEITGVVAGRFDPKNQLTGILLEAPSLSDVKILKRSKTGPEALPVTPMDEILGSSHIRDLSRRIRVQGTITYFEPGAAIVLQSGTKSLWINTQSEKPLRVGYLADVTGFAAPGGDLLALSLGEIWESDVLAPIAAQPVSEPELASGTHACELVSTEGQVLTSVRQADQDEYVLVSDGHIFSALYRHTNDADGSPLPPLKPIPAGSTVRVTGISMVNYGANPFQGPVSFSLLMRSFDDITVVAEPSWLSVRNLVWIVSLLVAVVFAVGFRQWTLERKIHRQTIALAGRVEAKAALERRMAQLEQRRSHILEDINGSRPLAEIIEQITGLVSLTLSGVPCWCEIAGGARLGATWTHSQAGRVLHQDILSHSGQVLGILFAAVDEEKSTASEEAEALTVGARLATLAIETRRIYSDLLYRSEFDQLTGVHNRFSLDKHLDRCIEDARQKAGVFGLIYIDLDDFKQVNDVYGHHVGDLYLQEAAARMTRQLRAVDILARLGGDEFAALIPVARCRADVEEVALRLERCFDAPFTIERYPLQASASVGVALYPEDGATKDSMLTAADAAMYVAKQTRRPVGLRRPASEPRGEKG